MSSHSSHDITRIVLAVLVICLLLAGSLWTMLPFLGALIWATTIVVATWPVLLWFERHTGNRRKLAVVIMTVIVSAVFITPFCLVVISLLDAIQSSPAIIRDFLAQGLGPPPSWVSGIPIVGEKIAEQWQALAAGGTDAVVEAIRPYMRSAGTWAMSATGGIGMTIIQILFIVILVAILYAQGETAARGVLDFGRRLGGERGEATVTLAGQAVRSVALGVIVTALVQSTLSGIGLWASGIPHAAILTAVIFVLGVAQLGPMPILLPAIGWLFWTGQTGWATALLIWSLPVIALDNVLRPLLIRRGVQLPMLLIIAGVIGGLIGFGVLGLFVGPVILAATYTLTKAWIAEGSAEV
ncbi:putative PurR-regulated permease PerM [Povalibacter uvarum]|uniref:Putative PurR-regulated permease PerM n=1 Tax=Povalibacter uvarum TaxID=732238 RepID=A0A841HQK4_9GAMM|nr:AI-2E family transporter YdiK [Povalibacter uvarum]MBB6095156.1 putative PurR-regulated permease PerM [Povalibacter uvarum]